MDDDEEGIIDLSPDIPGGEIVVGGGTDFDFGEHAPGSDSPGPSGGGPSGGGTGADSPGEGGAISLANLATQMMRNMGVIKGGESLPDILGFLREVQTNPFFALPDPTMLPALQGLLGQFAEKAGAPLYDPSLFAQTPVTYPSPAGWTPLTFDPSKATFDARFSGTPVVERGGLNWMDLINPPPTPTTTPTTPTTPGGPTVGTTTTGTPTTPTVDTATTGTPTTTPTVGTGGEDFETRYRALLASFNPYDPSIAATPDIALRNLVAAGSGR